MANNEHIQLAQFLKDVHSSLRQSSLDLGDEKAWWIHCQNSELLSAYAKSMHRLATTFWQENSSKCDSLAISRIEWSSKVCYDYFIFDTCSKYHTRDFDIAQKLDLCITPAVFSYPLKMLDVGSCYNPFAIYDFLDVLAIDLYPAVESVMKCDFLTVLIGSEMIRDKNTILQLQENEFEVICFCFLLEYIPSSDLRVKACFNAYNLLKYGGLLIICTPDSKHVGANSKIMKNWQYTLACIGFTRIKYEKFKHMHCMAFRKALHKNVAVRWAELHKKPYMKFGIEIPQDSTTKEIDLNQNASKNETNIVYDFSELPFETETSLLN